MNEVTLKVQFIFGTKVAIAGILSFYLCSAFNLPQAQWAVLTACMILNPLSGFGRARGLYRILGTVLGAILGFIVYALFNDSPLAVLIISSSFVLGGAYVSYIYNSPRNYVFLIGGVTTLMVNMGASVGGPQVLFDTLVWRTLEIIIGVVVALGVDSLIGSPPIVDIFFEKVDAWSSTIEKWIFDVLQGYPSQVQDLYIGVEEIEILDHMIFHSYFESSVTQEQIRLMGILRKRMLVMIPTIASLKNQIGELKNNANHESIVLKEILMETERCVSLAGIPGKKASKNLIDQIDKFIGTKSDSKDWISLVERSLVLQIKHVLSDFMDIRLLRYVLKRSHGRQQIVLRAFKNESLPQKKHVDKKIAFLSVLPGILSVLSLITLWGLSGNSQLATAYMMGTMMSVFLGATDDPAKGIKGLMFLTVLMTVLGGIYTYALYPYIQTFIEMAVVLFVPLLVLGKIMATSRAGMMLVAMFVSNIGFQTRYTPNSFDVYIEAAIAMMIGFFVAMVSNQLVRSVSAEWMIERLVRLSRTDIGNFSEHGSRIDKYNFINVMLNRLQLIILRIRTIKDEKLNSVDLLLDLQAGYHLAYLRDHTGEIAPSARSEVHQFVSRAVKDIEACTQVSGLTLQGERLFEIDHAIGTIIADETSDSKTQDIVSHLMNLRLQFFTNAAPFSLEVIPARKVSL
jgi:uncharacterized membrane protein YccC